MAEQNCPQFSDPPITGPRAITRFLSASSAFISGKKFGLCDRFQHVRRRSVVAKRLTHVDEQIFVAWRKHKAAPKLKRIFSQPMLLVSGGVPASYLCAASGAGKHGAGPQSYRLRACRQ